MIIVWRPIQTNEYNDLDHPRGAYEVCGSL